MADNHTSPKHGKSNKLGRPSSPQPRKGSHSLSGTGSSYFTPKHHHSSHRGGGAALPRAGRNRSGNRRPPTPVLIALAAVLVAALGFGAYKIVSATGGQDDVPPGTEVTFTIPDGAGTSTIAGLLEDVGVIDDAGSFTSYVQQQEAENKIKPGDYRMQTGMGNEAVLVQLIAGPNDGLTLTIPEGYTIDQTAAKVEQDLGIPADEFLALCHNASAYESDYPFLAGAYNNSLEGYLFPKTYTFKKGVTADEVVRTMLTQFQTETSGIDLSYARSKGLDLNGLVTLASCVEKEAYNDGDRAHIAGVLYNRLDQGMPLGLDVTVSYIVGKPGTELTSDDLAVDSPYNTYIKVGLPPGPIASPGLASLQAAAAPEQTADLYFILTEDYSHFYTNYDEFLAGKAQWQAESGS